MTRPLTPARRIILRSSPAVPPPLPLAALVGYAQAAPGPDLSRSDTDDAAARDSVVPDSFIRDLRAVVGDPVIPPAAPLPDLDSWLEHDMPAAQAEDAQGYLIDFEGLAAELQVLTGYLRNLYARSVLPAERKLHPVLDINAPLEDLPVLGPPQLSILRWLWLALLCG
jgi:hypothetical protein